MNVAQPLILYALLRPARRSTFPSCPSCRRASRTPSGWVCGREWPCWRPMPTAPRWQRQLAILTAPRHGWCARPRRPTASCSWTDGWGEPTESACRVAVAPACFACSVQRSTHVGPHTASPNMPPFSPDSTGCCRTMLQCARNHQRCTPAIACAWCRRQERRQRLCLPRFRQRAAGQPRPTSQPGRHPQPRLLPWQLGPHRQQ